MKSQVALFWLVIPSLLLLCYVTYKKELLPKQAFLKEQLIRLHSRRTQEGPLNTSCTNNLQYGVKVETGEMDACLEGTLPSTFKSALDTYPIVTAADVKIVLVLAYYRSGSTFVGELLSSGPATFFHYEPLQLFTNGGRIRHGRQGDAFQLLNELVRCRMQEVPLYMAWLERHLLYKRNKFLDDVCQGGHSCSCARQVAALCQRSRTQVFKFTRLYVTQVAEWLDRNPEIAKSVQVVHLVRDPRAILSSCQALPWCDKSEKTLCAQMRSDLDAFDILARQTRPYTVHKLRFEDLAADPVTEAFRLFGLLGLDFAPSVLEYLKSHTVANDRDTMNAYSTVRDTRQVASSWKLKLQRNVTEIIEKACADVLGRLGYEVLFDNTTSMEDGDAVRARRVDNVERQSQM